MVKRQYVWIVELRDPRARIYKPTVAAALTKSEAGDRMKEWNARNVGFEYRVKKYEAVE